MDLEEIKKIIQSKIEAESLTKQVRNEIKSYIHKKQNMKEGFNETFKPFIKSQDKVKESLDKKQNALIEQLQKNQLALTEGLDKNRLAITQGFDKMDEVKKWDLQQLLGYEAIEDEEDKPVSKGDIIIDASSPPESTTEEGKSKTATFTDEDLDKGLGYKAASDYLDSLNLKLPSELKEMNLEDFEKNYLEKAEKILNNKKLQLKYSANFETKCGKSYAYPTKDNPKVKTRKLIYEYNILSDYIYNLNMLRDYKEKSGSGILHFNNPYQLLDRLELLAGSILAGNNGNNGVIQGFSQIAHLLNQMKVITKKPLNDLLKKYLSIK